MPRISGFRSWEKKHFIITQSNPSSLYQSLNIAACRESPLNCLNQRVSDISSHPGHLIPPNDHHFLRLIQVTKAFYYFYYYYFTSYQCELINV